MALRGSTGLGEAYFEGLWDVDDLVAMLRIATRNLAPFDRLRARFHPVVGPTQRLASHAYATERVRELGLERRVSVVLEDYRDLEGSYDRLVS